jgi:hypothetical protein
MALSYIRFTELDAVSSVAPNAILPVVETITNINKKISIEDFNNSLPLGTDVSVLKSLSGNWNSNYAITNANSANWTGVYNSVLSVSGDWNNTYTIMQTNSAGWEDVETIVSASSANWNNAYTNVSQSSANWNSVFTTISSTSAQYTQSFIGATATANGVRGVVPEPLSGQQVSYLKGDATWGTPGTFQSNYTTTTLPVCSNTGFQDFRAARWVYPIVDSPGLFGSSWGTNTYHFCQLRFFRPQIIRQIAASITSVTTPSPSDFMRIVICSHNEERHTPQLTLREIVSVPGILNTAGKIIFDVSPPLLVEPGAIWIGAIMSSGYAGGNQIFCSPVNNPTGVEMLNVALNGENLYFTDFGRSSKPYISTNFFARSYNASNTAPSNWDNERALYDGVSVYWNRSGNITQIWCAR